MNRNPYNVTGPCEACRRVPATSWVETRGERKQAMCNRCSDVWWQTVERRLAERGIQPVQCSAEFVTAMAFHGEQSKGRKA